MREVWSKRLALLGLTGLLLLVMSRNCVVDLDLFHEFALIREGLATGALPHVDVFSYVPTVSPAVHHEWGTGAVLYLITVLGGLGAPGLMVTKFLLVAAVSIGCYRCARREGAHDAVIAFLALFAILLGAIAMTNIRAQLFSLMFLVVLFLLLQLDRRGRRWWIALWLPLYVIWANLHGGSVVGLLLVVTYGAERFVAALLQGVPLRAGLRQVRHLVFVGAAMLALMMVNPYGLDNIRYVLQAVTLDRTQMVQEWCPLWRCLGDPLRPAVFLLSVVIGVYGVLKSTDRRAIGVVFLLAMACQAVLHYRHLSLYAVAWMCVVPAYVQNTGLGQALRDTWEHKRWPLALAWLFLLFIGVRTALAAQFWHLQVPTVASKRYQIAYPVGAVEYLKTRGFRGNLMVAFEQGSYVSWKLHPQVKVALDSRFEAAYPVAWAWQVARLYAGAEGWQETLTRYPTDVVLVARRRPLERLLEESDRQGTQANSVAWPRVYVDDGFALFARPEVAAGLPVVDRTGERITGTFP
jgi:hypothetical protein